MSIALQTLSVPWADATRQQHFSTWIRGLAATHQLDLASVQIASADASFRRYLRIHATGGAKGSSLGRSLIIMDAPPDKENCEPFVRIARLMQDAGLLVPEVLEWNEPLGFMLMTDLGHQTMMADINASEPQANLPQYLEATERLIQWQLASQSGVLPAYDEALLRRELETFPEWYVGRHLGKVLTADQRSTLDEAFRRIIAHNLQWPSVYVHRDYMPRNLMVNVPNHAPPLGGSSHCGSLGMGILDFQDAVYGPITYDIASLMRDAFLTWEEEFVLEVTIRYWEKARKAGLPIGDDFGAFYQGVEWMGLQRHLKVAGVFARLTLRDGKPKYLADTPRFIQYIRSTCSRYMELKPLLRLVENLEGIAFQSAFAYGRV